MSERDRYPSGIPCWTVALQADPRSGADFYAALFGWEIVSSAGGREGEFLLARLRGRDVAAIAPVPDGEPPVAAAWMTHVRVDSVQATAAPRWSVDFWVEGADATARLATELGGTVVTEPHDAPPFRQAVLADPEGAAFSISELVTVPAPA